MGAYSFQWRNASKHTHTGARCFLRPSPSAVAAVWGRKAQTVTRRWLKGPVRCIGAFWIPYHIKSDSISKVVLMFLWFVFWLPVLLEYLVSSSAVWCSVGRWLWQAFGYTALSWQFVNMKWLLYLAVVYTCVFWVWMWLTAVPCLSHCSDLLLLSENVCGRCCKYVRMHWIKNIT